MYVFGAYKIYQFINLYFNYLFACSLTAVGYKDRKHKWFPFAQEKSASSHLFVIFKLNLM